MNPGARFYPSNGMYVPIPTTIYAQYNGICPNPCRKYHISADPLSAKRVADAVLPYLSQREIFHKVVQGSAYLAKQNEGDQAGKFITIYMPASVAHRNGVITDLGALLANLKKKEGVRPNGSVPHSRQYQHLFIEAPLDEEMFIYGGFVCDPKE